MSNATRYIEPASGSSVCGKLRELADRVAVLEQESAQLAAIRRKLEVEYGPHGERRFGVELPTFGKSTLVLLILILDEIEKKISR